MIAPHTSAGLLVNEIERIGDVIHDIADRSEDEGDRVYFGSTNDAHTLVRQVRYLHKVVERLRQSAAPASEAGALPRATYAPNGLEFAAVDQYDAWLLRFSDQDCGDQWFGGADYTPEETRASAIDAWNRYAPAWSVRLMRTATLDEVRTLSRPSASAEVVELLREARAWVPCTGPDGRALKALRSGIDDLFAKLDAQGGANGE